MLLQYRPNRVASTLAFQYDDRNLSCLDQPATQHKLNQVLKPDLLVSAAFHGQADITSLLEVHPAGPGCGNMLQFVTEYALLCPECLTALCYVMQTLVS